MDSEKEKTTKEPQMVYTKKELKKMLMPKIGDIIDGDIVTYINLGKLRFTATYKGEPPIINADIIIEDKVYTIGHIDTDKKSYTATLSNVIQEDVPDTVGDEVTKLI